MPNSSDGEVARRITIIEKWLRRLESMIIRPTGSGTLHNAVTVTDTATINLTLTGQNIQADLLGISGHTIKDEAGAGLTARTNLNFTGAGVTATDNAGTNSTDVTIAGGAGASADGWNAIAGTFTYASATTINVSSGAVAIYNIGDKMRFQNNDSGTYLYGYVVIIADTLLTVAGNAVPNATLTDMYYSKACTPLGFPHWFPYTPTGIAATNVTLTGRFCVIGTMCYFDFLCAFSGGITFTTYPTLPIKASASIIGTDTDYIVSGDASYKDSGTAYILNNLYPTVVANGTTFKLLTGVGSSMGATLPITWINGDFIHAHVNYEI